MLKATCLIEGCESESSKRGWCNRHYLRWYRHGSTDARSSCKSPGCSSGVDGSGQLCPRHSTECIRPGCDAARAGRYVHCKRHKNYGGARLQAPSGQKRCRTCLVARPESDFYETWSTRDGLHDKCKSCFADYHVSHRGRARAWRVANRERTRDYNRIYEPRRKLLIKARNAAIAATQIPFTIEQLRQRFAYYGNRCWICRTAPGEHLDHVKPIHAGGPHILANMRPACAKCNWRKNKKWPLTERDLERIRAA